MRMAHCVHIAQTPPEIFVWNTIINRLEDTITNNVTATVSTSAPLSHYTYGQTAVSYFPEFGYGTYWRLLERLTSGTTARFQFAKNIYSTYNQRVHFSPVWFPDGSYTVNTHVMDIWTPAGMLAMNLTDDVTISGSLYDDGISHRAIRKEKENGYERQQNDSDYGV